MEHFFIQLFVYALLVMFSSNKKRSEDIKIKEWRWKLSEKGKETISRAQQMQLQN